ncbi:DUF1211 domain-containing protein [Henriciella barbarensis]|uniref:DUF1211 domain-containing protein n=1 Tax=Henriciella barbarensis TaxID=86342 RepID=A0A399R018_9PROT|nr:TMEM175 family protein [Henriciella barbarensis]RIJ24263.1 DUF1211 domain-containing protein [Henriciella barbarensis]
MLRETIDRELDHDPRFTWRGGSVTRIENLSDIVFALALGMIVSSAARPETFDQLTANLLTIIPVTAAFGILFMIWNAHYIFFRRYGVADGRIILLNCILLLLVLFTAYPLRFIFDSLYGYIEGVMGDWSRLQAAGINFREAGIIMGYFALGYGLIYFIISQMYAHALSKADLLGLNSSEIAMTRQSIWIFRVQILIVALTGACAVWTPMYAFSGWIMGLIWPAALLVDRLIPVPEADPDAPSTA